MSLSLLVSSLFLSRKSIFRSPHIIVLVLSHLFFSRRVSSISRKVSIAPSGDLYIVNISVLLSPRFMLIPDHSMSSSIQRGPVLIVLIFVSEIFSFANIAVPPCILFVLLKCVIRSYPCIFRLSIELCSCQCSVIHSISGFSVDV
uniref:Uncharacterized protein n=1 Tax=Cacopsylla melanoneura TaxID=428564 RepID=A0A8D8WUC2_9HEMI